MSLSLFDLGSEFFGAGGELVLLIEADVSESGVFDAVEFLLPDSPLVVVVIVQHPQRRCEQHQAAGGEDHVGLRQAAEETVGGRHETSWPGVEARY